MPLPEGPGALAHEVLAGLPDGVVVLGEDWTYRYVNDAGAAVLGTTVDALLGRRIWDLYPEGVGQPFHAAYERVLRTGVSETLLTEYSPWATWFENRVVRVPGGLAIFFREAPEPAVDAGAALRSVLAQVPLEVALEDRAGRIGWVNAEAAVLLPREDGRWALVSGSTPAEEREALARARAAAASTGEAQHVPLSSLGRTALLVPLAAADGLPEGTAVVLSRTPGGSTDRAGPVPDVDYHEVFRCGSVGQAVFDVRGRVLDANDALCRLLGFGRHQLVGRDYRDLREPDELSRQMRAELLSGRRPAVEWRRLLLRSDGTRIPVHSSVTTLRGDAGEVTAVSAAFVDLSEQEALQRRLMAKQRLESVGAVAGGVAHDLNNLMAVVLGHVELLSVEADASLGPHLLGLRRVVERASSLVDRLLAAAHQQVLKPERLRLDRLVEELLPVLRPLVAPQGALVADLGPTVEVDADPSQLQQVLLNLVSNARDALARSGGGTVELVVDVVDRARPASGVLPAGRYARVVVRDDGPGMDGATLAAAFDLFWTTKPGRSGGLGLATALGIARQSGGDLLASSRPGNGATFELLLPLATDPTSTPDVSGPGRRGTVLLAEDDDDLRALLVRQLEGRGLRVTAARDGAEALRAAEVLGSDLGALVTDLVMPTTDGLQLARRLREIRPDLPLVLMSGYHADASRTPDGLQDACFLQKPFPSSQLVEAVLTALGDAP